MHCRNVFTIFQDVIHELLNMDPYMVPEEAPLKILGSKSDVCINKNGKDTKQTRHIARQVNFVRNG